MRRFLGHVRLLLSAFGICFALLSSLRELWQGEIAKTAGALALGLPKSLSVGRPKRE